MLWIILIVIVVLAVAGAPGWYGPSYPYGWYPSGLLGVLLVLVLVLVLLRLI